MTAHVGCPIDLPAVFEPADPPRAGRLVFWAEDAEPIAHVDGVAGTRTVVRVDAGEHLIQNVSTVDISLAEALPTLLLGTPPDAHPAMAFWSAAVRHALVPIARGRLLPGISDTGYPAWRVGPLDSDDLRHIDELAAAMPLQCRAVVADPSGPAVPKADRLVRALYDALADHLPRGPAASTASGVAEYAAVEPVTTPHLRPWCDDVATGIDAGVRISLRMEVPDGDLSHGAFRAVVQAHSLADPALVTDVADLGDDGQYGFGPRARIEAMLAVRRAARAWQPLERLLRGATPDQLDLADDEVTELLASAAIKLSAAGVDVHWPKDLARSLTARATIESAGAPPSDVQSFFGTDKLLTFRWQVALGDAELTEAELDQLAEAQRPLIRLRDQWVLVDPALAQKARDRMLKPVTAIDALGVALTGTAEVDGSQVTVAPNGWLETLRARIAEPDDGAEPVDQPATLAASLRDYQLRGLRWLARMTGLGLGGCLADDMGLGKTITLIALHLHRQTDPATAGPTLVVCPASLLGNWEREITRFAPGTPVTRYHGSQRSLHELDGGVVLTTYGTMRRDHGSLAELGWQLLVADEAQHVKNPFSSTAKALRRIRASARVALTGTPVENNLSELWAILDWTTPGLLGTLTAFRSKWAKSIESEQDKAKTDRFADLVRPFLLRRRKSDPGIAPELPAKTETDQAVTLTREQATLYQAVVKETMASIRGSSGMQRRGLVLKLLTALKQICNHPAQYLKEPTPVLAGRSGKLELLDELLDTIVAENGAALVFTQYVSMAKLLHRHLTARGIASQLLHGGTPVRQRDEQVARFQDGEVPVFLLSLKAAGTGLNLTRADHVLHYDRWWNPAVEDQATDRAYRIGQTKAVQVHRLVAQGSVEERVAAMLQDKRDLADAVLRGGESALSELSDTELAEIVQLHRGAP